MRGQGGSFRRGTRKEGAPVYDRTEKNIRRTPERLLMAAALLTIAALFCFFLLDILIPFLDLQMKGEPGGARALLRERGALGFLAVTLVETLQMALAFIPAGIIPIACGLGYPFPIALLLCELGVCAGAALIFVLARVRGFRPAAYEKRRLALERFTAGLRDRPVTARFYLLVFMPLIPFGVICYYGSGSRIRYGRYIFTVATGALPSIAVSSLIGTAVRVFLVNGRPLWPLLIIAALLAAVHAAGMFLLLDRFCFRESDGTPDSPVYALIFLIARLWLGNPKLVIEDRLLRDQQPPYVVLCNHESFTDFYCVSRLAHPRNPSFLLTAYYSMFPFLRRLGKKIGLVFKRLFTPDMSVPLGIMRTVRKGFPIIIFPEGRLSPDGRSNPIAEPGALFYKKLGVDLVLVRIRGAYYANPKWRRARFRSEIHVTVERVLRAEEIRNMPDAVLDALIAGTLYTDESAGTEKPIRRGGKAKGLETLLYRCADCGALYTTRGEGNALRCVSCGAVHALDGHYRFTSGPPSIPDYYGVIRGMERAELDALDLRCETETKIFGKNGVPARKERGECRLTREAFSYRSASEQFSVPTENLPALNYDNGVEFEIYHNGELHYFYPLTQRQQVTRWALAVDLLAEERSRRTSRCG